MPLITDLLKEGQEILVQIAKEPIGKKGARITSHIALPGRFLVYMPTVNHTGVSRKIASEEERQRLKADHSKRTRKRARRIYRAYRGDECRGRRSARGHPLPEGLWAEIKSRADAGKGPTLIYHDLNVVERVLRDQVTSDFSAIWVDSDEEYERILRFANRFQPALVKRVKLYTKEAPLYEQFGLSEEINKALKSKVWLKSGGYIVINQTEALVAIDVNTGKIRGQDDAPRRHHRQNQRGRDQGNRAPDPAARPGRHHHHRFHRYGRTPQPPESDAGAGRGPARRPGAIQSSCSLTTSDWWPSRASG